MATDKNFVIKNGLTINGSEIITSAGNLTNIGTISSGAIDSSGQSFLGSTSAIRGTSTDATANVSYLGFYESDRTTRQGYVGYGSTGNTSLYLTNDVSNSNILFRIDGDTRATFGIDNTEFATNVSLTSGHNLTVAGTISSGVITSTGVSIESATANLTLKDTSDDDDHQIYFKDNGGTVRYQITSAGDQFNFATNGSREIVFLPSDTEALRLDSSQNATFAGAIIVSGDATFDTSTLKVDSTNNRVGIGITNPSHPLTVSANPSDGQLVKFKRTSAEGAWLELENSEGGFGIGTDAGELNIYDRGDGAYRFTIDTSGHFDFYSGNLSTSGYVTIDSSTDGKLKLKTPSGESTDWNYIEFYGADDTRDGYVGTDADGDMKFFSDKNSSELRLESSGATISTNLTVTGDLTVNGTTTTVNQTNLDVSDNLIGLNRGASSNSNDSGMLIERGSTGDNVFIGWDESSDKITFATTTNVPSDTGNLTLTAAPIQASSVGVTNIVTNKVVKFDGSILDDSNITDTGSLITLGSDSSIANGSLYADAEDNWVGINTTSHIGSVLNVLDVDDESVTLRLHTNTNSHNPALRMNAKNSSGTQQYADIKYNPDSPSFNFYVPYNETTPTLKIADGSVTVDGSISSTGLVTIDANNNGNTLHIHDDATSGQPGMVVTNTGNVSTSTQTFYAKQYGSAVGGSLFGQSIANKSFVGTEGSAHGGLLIGTVTADSVWIGTNNTAALTINSSQNATFAGTINSGAITSSGNLHAGDGTDISMDASANGQIEVDGDGYQGAIALDSTTMAIYHNSSSRSLTLGTNETARIIIGGTGGVNFNSNNLTSVGTISSGAITASSTIAYSPDVGGDLTLSNDGSYGTVGSGRYLTLGFGGTTNGYNRIFAGNTTDAHLFIASATGRGIFFRTNGGNADSVLIDTTSSIQARGQIRATGWYNSQSSDNLGTAAEIGAVGTNTYVIGYDRTNTTYRRLYVEGAGLTFDGHNSTVLFNDASYISADSDIRAADSRVRIGNPTGLSGRSGIRIDTTGDAAADLLFGDNTSSTGWANANWSLSSRATSENQVFRIYRGAGQPSPYNSEAVAVEISRDLTVSMVGATFSGNVGIGVAPDAAHSLKISSDDNEPVEIYGSSGGAWINIQSSGSLQWSMGADSTGWGLYDRSNGAYRMQYSSGNGLMIREKLRLGALVNAEFELDFGSGSTSDQSPAARHIRFPTYNGPSDNSGTNSNGGIKWESEYSGYTKESASIKGIAQGNYFRTGIGFFVGNDQNQTTNATAKMVLHDTGQLSLNKGQNQTTLNAGGFGTPQVVMKQLENSTWGGINIEANGNDSIFAISNVDDRHIIAGSYRATAGFKDLEFSIGNNANVIRLKTDGDVCIGQSAATYSQNDNTRLVGSTTSNKLHVNGSIQLTSANDAIVFGAGTATFLSDEELGFGWGGGWYMTDGTYLRVRNNKHLYSTGAATFGSITNTGTYSQTGGTFSTAGASTVTLTDGFERVKFNGYDLLGYSSGSNGLWVISNVTANASNQTTLTLGTEWDWDDSISFKYVPAASGSQGGVLTIGQDSKNSTSWNHDTTNFNFLGSTIFQFANTSKFEMRPTASSGGERVYYAAGSYTANRSVTFQDVRMVSTIPVDHKYCRDSSGNYGYKQENWWDGDSYQSLSTQSNSWYFHQQLYVNGNITAYGSPSDIRLKENIETIQDPVEKVQKLRGVTFNYKSDGSKSTGLIAQELEEVLPEVVYEANLTEGDNLSEEKYKAVRYGNIVGLLVEAIKEQQKQIEELKEEVSSLRSKN